MPATFNRAHNWTLTEIITTAALNAEFNNILNNLDPTGVGSYSTTVAQMQITTSPGSVGSESQATSLGGELERLRFQLKAILGTSATQWYSSPTTDLTQIKAALGSTLNTNRIVSGPQSTASSAARFLTPGNTTPAITVNGATTPLVYAINGNNYTIATNLVVGSLGTASAATAIIADPRLAGQEASKWAGEDNTTIAVSNASAAITSLIGNWGAFSVVDSGKTEYFMAFVQSASALTNCLRGYFMDSNQAAVQRIPINNNSTISLMKLSWLYGSTASSVLVGYTPPTFSYSQPSSPATGDYWFNINTQVWMTFNSATWVTAYATLLGACAQNTANCVAAHAFDYFNTALPYSNLILNYNGTASMIAQNWGSKIGVGTNLLDFKNTKPVWSSSSLDPNSTVAFTAATSYWAYVGEAGQLFLSWHKPYQSAGNGQGWYHPYENWRTVGFMKTNSSTAFDSTTLTSYTADPNSTAVVVPGVSYNYFVNGAFDYWQALGTAASVTAAGGASPTNVLAYIPDQWYVNNILGAGSAEGVITGSQQAGSNPGSQFGFQVAITTTPSGTGVQTGVEAYQVLSNPTSIALMGRTVSVGILVKAAGNVNQVGLSLLYNTSSTKVATGSGTLIGSEVITNINSTGWTSCAINNQTVGTAMTTNGVIGLRVRISGVSSGNAWDINNGFILEQAQLNNGSLGLFDRQNRDALQELTACQYFYEKSYEPNTTPGSSVTASGLELWDISGHNGTAQIVTSTPFKIRKRAAPTVTTYDGTGAATRVSFFNSSLVRTDNQTGFATIVTSTRNFNITTSIALTSTAIEVAFHWVADARI